jgi:hypothetical protein
MNKQYEDIKTIAVNELDKLRSSIIAVINKLTSAPLEEENSNESIPSKRNSKTLDQKLNKKSKVKKDLKRLNNKNLSSDTESDDIGLSSTSSILSTPSHAENDDEEPSKIDSSISSKSNHKNNSQIPVKTNISDNPAPGSTESAKSLIEKLCNYESESIDILDKLYIRFFNNTDSDPAQIANQTDLADALKHFCEQTSSQVLKEKTDKFKSMIKDRYGSFINIKVMNSI